MKCLEKIIAGILLASVLLQPLGLVTPALAETVEMEYTDPNHLHAPNEVTVDGNRVDYQYDANGNLTFDGERRIEWNQDNLPIRITREVNGETQVVEFFYDASGRRIFKKSFLISNPTNVDTTTYVSGSYQKSVVNGVETTTKYYFANGRVAVRNTTPSTGEDELTFLHQDHLGSTILATGPDSQPLFDTRLAYFPYGKQTTSDQLPVTNYQFTGQEKDPESDLYNYNARLYNPTTGAFISADSVGGGNRYAYAANNPMMFVDPSGNANEPTGGVGGSNPDDVLQYEISGGEALYADPSLQATGIVDPWREYSSEEIEFLNAVCPGIECNPEMMALMVWGSGMSVITAAAVGYVGYAGYVSVLSWLYLHPRAPVAAYWAVASLLNFAAGAQQADLVNSGQGDWRNVLASIAYMAFGVFSGVNAYSLMLPPPTTVYHYTTAGEQIEESGVIEARGTYIPALTGNAEQRQGLAQWWPRNIPGLEMWETSEGRGVWVTTIPPDEFSGSRYLLGNESLQYFKFEGNLPFFTIPGNVLGQTWYYPGDVPLTSDWYTVSSGP